MSIISGMLNGGALRPRVMGGSSLEVGGGDPIAGASPHRVLFTDETGALKDSPDLLYDDSLKRFQVNGVINGRAVFTSTTPNSPFIATDITPTINTSGSYSGTTTGFRISALLQSTVGATVNLLDVGTNSAAGGAGIHTSLFSVTPSAVVTVAPLWILGGASSHGPITFLADSSTAVNQNQARLIPDWAESAHATRKGRLTLTVCDYTGTDKDGLVLESDGTRANASFLGIVSSALEYRLLGLSFSRVAQTDGGGGWAGGYNFNINGGVAQHDSPGASSGIWFDTGGRVLLYADANKAAGTHLNPVIMVDSTGTTLAGPMTVSPIFSPVSGAASYAGALINGTCNTSGSFSGTFTGLQVSPYLQSITGATVSLLDVGTNSAAGGSGTHTSLFSVTPTNVVTVAPLRILGGVSSHGSGNILTNESFGLNSLASNTTGVSNAAFGRLSLYLNTTGGYNSAFGEQALISNLTGNSNTALGYSASYSNTTGVNNTSVGYLALSATTLGGSNTAVGCQALFTNTTGANNTAIGVQADLNKTSGDSCTALGAFTSTGSFIGSTALGVNAACTANNQVMLGTAAETVVVPGTLSGVTRIDGAPSDFAGLVVDSSTDANRRLGIFKYPGLYPLIVAGKDSPLQLGHRTDTDNVSAPMGAFRADLTVHPAGGVTVAGLLTLSNLGASSDVSGLIVDLGSDSYRRFGVFKYPGLYPVIVAGKDSPLQLGHRVDSDDVSAPMGTFRSDLTVDPFGDTTVSGKLLVSPVFAPVSGSALYAGTVINGTCNTSGSFSGTFTGLRVSPYLQSTVGATAVNLLDLGTNSVAGGVGTHTSSFLVDSTGNVTARGQISVAGPSTAIRFSNGIADNGGYLISSSPSQAILAGGTKWNGTNMLVMSPQAEMIACQLGEIRFYSDTGLTVGTAWSPTERMSVLPTGVFVKDHLTINSVDFVNGIVKLYVGSFDGQVPLLIHNATGGVNEKRWDTVTYHSALSFRTTDDAYTHATEWLNISRVGEIPSITVPVSRTLFSGDDNANCVLAVRGGSGDVANLQEWRLGSTGAVVTKVAANGKVTMPSRDGPIATPTDGVTITFDCATDRHTVIMGGNRTLAVTNDTVGQQFTVILVQDGTGSKLVTWWSGIKWAGGTVPTLTTTANKADVFTFLKTGPGAYYGFVPGQNL